MDQNIVLYELGYHITPSVPEGEVVSVLEAVKKNLLEIGGNIVGEELPQLVSLSYPIPQYSDTGIKKFEKAYFGWFKFELEAGKLEQFSGSLKANLNILRFLITKTDKGNMIMYHKPVVKQEEVLEQAKSQDIDQQIENLVIE